MSPLEFAKQECANWDQGRCLGADLGSDLQTQTVHPLPQCALTQSQRCAYFERCVLPLARRGRQDFIDAARVYTKYRASGDEPAVTIPVHSTCTCGKARAPRKRFCLECARNRRRATTRNGMRKKRSSCEQLRSKIALEVAENKEPNFGEK